MIKSISKFLIAKQNEPKLCRAMNLKKRLTSTVNNEVIRNMSTLSFGTILAQIVPFLFSPFIARLYTAEQYGEFAALIALVNVVGVVVNGRYDLCIVLPKNTTDAKRLVQGSWLIAILISIASCFGVYFFMDLIQLHFSTLLELSDVLIVGGVLLCIGFWQPLNYFFIREKWFKQIALNKVVQTSSNTIATLFFGWIALKNGLVIGFVFGWVFISVFSYYQARRKSFSLEVFSLEKVTDQLKLHIEFPKYNALPALLNSIASQLGVYIFVFHYSAEVGGYYSFSKMYILVPLSIIGGSLAQVYFQRVANKFANNITIFKELGLLTLTLSAVGVSVLVFIHFFGDITFRVIFGEDWLSSAIYSKILMYYFVIQFVVSPLNSVLIAIGKVKLASVFPTLYVISMFSMFFIPELELHEFLKIYTLAESIPYLISLFLIVYSVRKFENKIKLNNPVDLK